MSNPKRATGMTETITYNGKKVTRLSDCWSLLDQRTSKPDISLQGERSNKGKESNLSKALKRLNLGKHIMHELQNMCEAYERGSHVPYEDTNFFCMSRFPTFKRKYSKFSGQTETVTVLSTTTDMYNCVGGKPI